MTFLEARKKFLLKNFTEQNSLIKKKFWVRKFAKFNSGEFYNLARVIDGLILRKYPDEMVVKLLELDRNDLISMRTFCEQLERLCNKEETTEIPFSIPYEGVDFDIDGERPRPKKKRKKIKGLGKNQSLVLSVVQNNFEPNEEFKTKDVQNLLDEDMANVSGILKVVMEKTGEIEHLGKKKWRRV